MISKEKAAKFAFKKSEKLNEFLELNYPQSIKDGAPNLKAIAQLLGINESQNLQGYELTFPGKGIANELYKSESKMELKLASVVGKSSFLLGKADEQAQGSLLNDHNMKRNLTQHSRENTTPQNAIIVGDNLDALKLLKQSYFEKVKMIYIDPPYNTKNENFIYPDNYRADEIFRELGLLEVDEDGKEVESEAVKFFKNIASTKSHSGWLAFMLPRLKLARDLLKDDGVIFISIDDNEQANLKLLCDEIFGEENFVANVIWQKSYSPINLKKHFSNSHDYVLCYAKNMELLVCNGLPRDEDANNRYINPDNDPRGLWKPATLSVGPAVQENIYEITTPTGRTILPNSNYSWMFSKERYQEMLADNRIWFGESQNNVPSLKRFLSEVKNSITPMTNWHYDEVNHQQDAMRNLKSMFDDVVVFDYPKPVELVKRMLQLYTNVGGRGGAKRRRC